MVLGQKILTASNKAAIYELDLSKYPNGTYLIKINNGNETILKRIIKH
jgi:hypothetical protein